MAKDKEMVKIIHYTFNSNDLFLNLGDLDASLYKIDESIQQYVDLCKTELQVIYSEAEIEVVADNGAISTAEIYVESLIYVEDKNDFQEMPDPDEFDTVANICERVFSEQFNDWTIPKEFMPIAQVRNHVKIPLAVVRWLCVNRLIQDTSNSTGRWQIGFDEVSKIQGLIELVANQEQLEILPNQSVPTMCYLEDLKDIFVITIPEHINLLIVSKNGFDNDLFTPDSSLLLIRRVEHQVEVVVEHFVDVMGWSNSRWRYPVYVEKLESQAKQKGITCKKQSAKRNGKEEVDGVTFQLSKKLTQEITLQRFVDEVLYTLSEVVSNTVLSLNGGPVWDEIYEQKGQELLFHKKILSPLLYKMYKGRVFYTHGNRGEHGRDFVFVDTTKFQDKIYYGLQAKSGGVSGGANRDIETIVSQIERAFLMPFTPISEKSEVYISVMVIAISGKFTKDAKEVIRKQMPRYVPIGSVYFWDKNKIQFLSSQYFNEEND